jgi:cyclopropane-fatty-acyl-phospholipid synthase
MALAAGTRSIAAEILGALFGTTPTADFGVVLWDGTRVTGEPTGKSVLHVNSPGALRAAFAPPLDVSLGRAFAAGLLDVEGDFEHAVDTLIRASARLRPFQLLRIWSALRRLPKTRTPRLREAKLRGRMHSRARDRAAIGFHYDQPVEFYRSFLGREMAYSAAYYDDGVETLDDAQSAKLDYILRKLRLQPGERFLDIGCGWGALILRAAQRFGARVLGITLSRVQYEEAQRQIVQAHAEDRVRVELRDYRELRGEMFDKIASVGMFEHVGRSRLPEYFRSAYAALRPGGLFLNSGIANGDLRTGKVTGFMARFIFPDGELVPIGEAMQIAQECGFEVRDVENLREHYMRTARAWITNLERNRERAVATAGVESWRLWRLYLAGSAQGFRVGRLGLFQTLLARPHSNGRVDLPPTRRDLYPVASSTPD